MLIFIGDIPLESLPSKDVPCSFLRDEWCRVLRKHHVQLHIPTLYLPSTYTNLTRPYDAETIEHRPPKKRFLSPLRTPVVRIHKNLSSQNSTNSQSKKCTLSPSNPKINSSQSFDSTIPTQTESLDLTGCIEEMQMIEENAVAHSTCPNEEILEADPQRRKVSKYKDGACSGILVPSCNGLMWSDGLLSLRCRIIRQYWI